MRANRFLAGGLAGVTALAVVAGCAGQIKQVEPKLALRDAAQQLGGQKQGGFAVKFTGNVDDLIAAARKDPDFAADDTQLVKDVFGSTLTVAYDLDAKATAVQATIAGIPGTELRVVGQTLYVKAPVAELAKKFTGDDNDLDQIRRQDRALGALLDGGWVSLDTKSVQQESGLPAQDATGEKAAAEVKKSAQNLVDGATVTRDPKDAGHLIVTTSSTKAYAELKRLVTAVAGDDDTFADEFRKPPKDRPIVLDLWIDDQKLTALELNLLQFVDGAPGRAALRLDMTTSAPISAPQDATKIDPAALTALQNGAVDATGEAEMLGYDVLDRAQEDGGQPANYLKQAIADLAGPGTTAKIVRRGVAEVTVSGAKACLKLPSTSTKEPTVTPGACS